MQPDDSVSGLLLVDKPVGWTSFDVVAKMRGVLKASGIKKLKVGHTGTLDPLASGLLVLLIGNKTKQAQQYSKMDKTYLVEMKLGENSSTGDEEGKKTSISTSRPTLEEVKTAIESFLGQSQQIPPQYSAIKVAGQRAYALARQGKTVKLEPRDITIHRLELKSYRYPFISLEAEVSSGTYIRSLVSDIGEKMHTGAYMTSLCRSTVGPFSLSAAIKPGDTTFQAVLDALQNSS